MTAITVNNLSKKYTLEHIEKAQYQTFSEKISKATNRIFKKISKPNTHNKSKNREEFMALNNVSFEVKKGDRVGIIGRNGSGKSTLLKILSKITPPTSGTATLEGKIASLLEVGTGFHPELTGRENIFLNGSILGMKKNEILKNFDAIVDFSEIERFLDTPVKRYSSGMYVRLAFSVAAHLDPDILIVDEVLAVGDSQFQRKCIGKMSEASCEGRTILFVSHNINTLTKLCNKGILLKNGRLESQGELRDVIQDYTALDNEKTHTFINESINEKQKATLIKAMIIDHKKRATSNLYIDQFFSIEILWALNINVPFLRLGIDIINEAGIIVLSTMDTDTNNLLGCPREPATYLNEVYIPEFTFMPGSYSVKIFSGIPGLERIMEHEHVIQFEIFDNNSHLSHIGGRPREGFIATPLKWTVNRT